MKFNGFVGPSYILDSVNVDCQRCVNLYPELIESGTGKEAQVAYLKSTPGLELIGKVGTGPIRLVQVDTGDRIFVVSGSDVFQFTFALSVWSSKKIGSLLTTTGQVSATSTSQTGIDGYQTDKTIFVDGVDNYAFIYSSNTNTSSFGNFASFGYSGKKDATNVVWIDGYLVFNKLNTNYFYVSDLNSLTVNPLSFASSEGNPDSILTTITNNRDLLVFNERSVEVFVNTGNSDFPFQRAQGGLIEKGTLAPLSVKKIDSLVFWIGRDALGQGQVYSMQGIAPQRISTHAIEQAISNYQNPGNATAYTYQQDGHSFYVINFDEATWAYDLATKLWHERSYVNNGVFERHRADTCTFYSPKNIHLCGDYKNNKVYSLNPNYYSDDGNPLVRMRVFPHVSNATKRLFCSSLMIDMETGIGLNDSASQGYDPQITLEFSYDSGHTWSNEKQASIGKIGVFKTRVYWRRLGVLRDGVFRIKISDPVPVTLLSAEIEVEPGLY